jgi:tRNA(Ile)-lysidine synthase
VLPLPSAGWVYKGSFHGATAVKGFLASLPKDDSVGCVLDASGLTFPLLVRSRLPGDRYRPLGAPGAKKLKEILRAKGVPEDERAARPVFVSGRDIVWVQGLPISENSKITPKTQKILRIISVPKGTDSEKRKRS